jgi:hypothetical protein
MDAETRLPDLAGYTRKVAFVHGLYDAVTGCRTLALGSEYAEIVQAYLDAWRMGRAWIGDERPVGAADVES